MKNESEVNLQTPGAMLKKARIAQGFSIIDVASRLCLSVQFIEDIERDDYSRMSALTYARGYVLSYAHMLGISDSAILAAFSNLKIHFAPSKSTVTLSNEQSMPVYQAYESSQQHSSVMVWGTIVAIIILLGLLIMWWQGPKNAPNRLNTPANSSQSSTTIPLQPEPQRSAPQSSPQPANPQSPTPQPGQGQQPAAPLPPPAPSSERSTVQPSEIISNNQSVPNRVMKPNVDLPEPRETGNE